MKRILILGVVAILLAGCSLSDTPEPSGRDTDNETTTTIYINAGEPAETEDGFSDTRLDIYEIVGSLKGSKGFTGSVKANSRIVI